MAEVSSGLIGNLIAANVTKGLRNLSKKYFRDS